MGYAAGYKSGYFGGYLTEPAPPVERVEHADAIPDLVVQMAFESFGQPLTWYDISEFVSAGSGFSLNRGRSAELEEFNVGTAHLTLRNEDGRFDPDNTLGPYYPLLKPKRQVRIGMRVGSGATPFTFKRSWVGGDDSIRGSEIARPLMLIRGDSGSFDRDWGKEGRTATVELEVIEHLARLDVEVPTTKDPVTNEVLPINVTGTTGDAIVQLLSLASWPGASGSEAPLRNEFVDIDKGEITMLLLPTPIGDGVPISGSYLSALRQLALTEGGEFYFSRDGKVTFRQRGATGAQLGIWGDEGGLPYAAIRSRPADELIINEVTIEQSNHAKTTVLDPQSQSDYGPADHTWQVYPIPDPSLIAYELLGRYSQPRERITGFQPLGRRSVAAWRQIFRADFGDLVRFQLHPVYGGVVDRTLRIEGVQVRSPNHFEIGVDWSASESNELAPNLLYDEQADFENGVSVWVPTGGMTLAVVDPADPGPKSSGFIVPDGGAPHGLKVLAFNTNDVTPSGAYIDTEMDIAGTYFAGGYFAGVQTLIAEWMLGAAVISSAQVSVGGVGFPRTYKFAGLSTSHPAGADTIRLRIVPGLSGRGALDALVLRRTS